MKILCCSQISAIDQATIKEGVSSLDLINRAGEKCTQLIREVINKDAEVLIFVGAGNNGADGLVIGLKLEGRGYRVKIIDCTDVNVNRSGENAFLFNQCKLRGMSMDFYNETISLSTLSSKDLIVDALLGNGLGRPIDGRYADCISTINRSPAKVLSIDIPSGLADMGIATGPCVKADMTITIQHPRLAFMFRENAQWLGSWKVIDIGLSTTAIAKQSSSYHLVTEDLIRGQFKSRSIHAHKGDFGYALIVAGEPEMTGAAQLSALGSMRVGAGKCSLVYTDEATGTHGGIREITSTTDGAAISITKGTCCVGPGLGVTKSSAKRLTHFLQHTKTACVLDADAITLLSRDTELWCKVPSGSVLTPHTKELHRMVGECQDDAERLNKARSLAKERNVVIVLKGHHTAVIDPSGQCYFNSTGNPGMATGGSGDVLSGIITGYICQGYTSLWSAILGVYMHGRAGDVAAQSIGQDSLMAMDIVDYIPVAITQTIRKSV